MAGAGRTDSGVHARGQVAAFDTSASLSTRAFQAALNRLLPEDLAVVTAIEAAGDFDPRRHAKCRWYRYRIAMRRRRSPLDDDQALAIGDELDVDAMAHAASLLAGRHDFVSFTTYGEDAPGSTLRDMYVAHVEVSGGTLDFDLIGSAFLPQQVRRTVTALLRVGLGRRSGAWFSQLLLDAQPGSAGSPAPPQGLCLMAVCYGPPHEGLARFTVMDDGRPDGTWRREPL